MGKRPREIKKTVKGLANLDYVEFHHVPMSVNEEFGNLVDADVIKQMERQAAQEIIKSNLPIRGQEVSFFRSIFALSQREFAEKLGLSHVAIFKWEKAKNKRLDLVNEVVVKILVAGLLGLEITAALDNLVSHQKSPEKLELNFSDAHNRVKRKTA